MDLYQDLYEEGATSKQVATLFTRRFFSGVASPFAPEKEREQIRRRREEMEAWIARHNPMKMKLQPGERSAWSSLARIVNTSENAAEILRRVQRDLEMIESAPAILAEERNAFYRMRSREHSQNRCEVAFNELVDHFAIGSPYARDYSPSSHLGHGSGKIWTYLPEHLQTVGLEGYDDIYDFGVQFYAQELRFTQKFLHETRESS